MFGITEEANGYFPHHFIAEGNQHYIGPILYKKYCCPEKMTLEVYSAFSEWCGSQAGEALQFEGDVVNYCRCDVEALAMWALEVRNIL